MIELEYNIPLPPEKTWEFLVQTAHIRKWWGEGVLLEPCEKGKFLEPWTDETGQKRVTTGIVTAFEPRRRLQLNWTEQGWTHPTRVEFLLSPSQSGTRLYLQHSGWDVIGDEAARRKAVDAHLKGWENHMRKFTHYCATEGI